MMKKRKLHIPIIIPNQAFYSHHWHWYGNDDTKQKEELGKQFENQKLLSLKKRW